MSQSAHLIPPPAGVRHDGGAESAVLGAPDLSNTQRLAPLEELPGILSGAYYSNAIVIDATLSNKPVLVKYMRTLPISSVNPDAEAHMKTMKRLLRELLPGLKAVSHRNIMPMLGYKVTGVDRPCLLVSTPPAGYRVLEDYVRGIEPACRISISEKLDLLHQAGQGLALLHNQTPPIIHGGILPEAIIVLNQYPLQARLFDAGLDFIQRRVDASLRHDSSDQMVPWARFRSPEALLEIPPYSVKEDVYSFAGVMLALLSGKPPFWSCKQILVVTKIIEWREKPSRPDHPGLAPDDPLWEVMGRQWEFEPDSRPDMTFVLEEIASHPESSLSRPDYYSLIPEPEPIVSSKDNFTLNTVSNDGWPEADELPGTLERVLESDSDWRPMQGSFSDVHRAIWRREDGTEIDVAVKVLRTARISGALSTDMMSRRMVKRVRRESVVWNKLVHPNILRLYGYRLTLHSPSLISPWCPNGNLQQYLSVRPHLTISERFQLLLKISDGLAYLHSTEPAVAHGDLNSRNVVMGANDSPQICDFGLTRFMDQNLNALLETSGNHAGTLGYRAPELESKFDCSQETDVFALGCLMLEVLSGRVPFYGLITRGDIVQQKRLVAAGQPPDPGDHPNLPDSHGAWNVMRLCWLVDPVGRPKASDVFEQGGFEFVLR